MIKEQNKLKKQEEHPTLLLIPETNLSATFEKVGYLGLKNIPDKNHMNYDKFTTLQESKVK